MASASARATRAATASGLRPDDLVITIGLRAPASMSTARSMSLPSATTHAVGVTRGGSKYSIWPRCSDSTSRGSVRYTGPCGSLLAMARARSTTVSTWLPMRSS